MGLKSGQPLSWEEWLNKHYPKYNYEKDIVARGEKKANAKFSYFWGQYEDYLEQEGAR